MWKTSGEIALSQRGDLNMGNFRAAARAGVQRMLEQTTGGAVRVESEILDAGGIDFVLGRRSVTPEYEPVIVKAVGEQLGVAFRVSRQTRQVPSNINPACLGDAETLVVTRLAQPVRKYSMPMCLSIEAVLALLLMGCIGNVLFIVYLWMTRM